MLYRRGVQSFANGGKVAFPCGTVVVIDADFDESVRFQVNVDFFQYGVRETVLGDGNDGREAVRLGAQFAALFGCDLQYGVPLRTFWRNERF